MRMGGEGDHPYDVGGGVMRSFGGGGGGWWVVGGQRWGEMM